MLPAVDGVSVGGVLDWPGGAGLVHAVCWATVVINSGVSVGGILDWVGSAGLGLLDLAVIFVCKFNKNKEQIYKNGT